MKLVWVIRSPCYTGHLSSPKGGISSEHPL